MTDSPALKRPVAVLLSGRGSNLQALHQAAQADDFPCYIALVLSNKPDALGLDYARQSGIPAYWVDPSKAASPLREDYDALLHAYCVEAHIEMICLAGYMRLLSPWFVHQWHNRLLNIHPSLLPDFPGLHAVRQALEAGVSVSGCTVHWVHPAMDAGPVIMQASVNIQPQDDETTLAARILEAEHRCYPAVLRLWAEGRLPLEDVLPTE